MRNTEINEDKIHDFLKAIKGTPIEDITCFNCPYGKSLEKVERVGDITDVLCSFNNMRLSNRYLLDPDRSEPCMATEIQRKYCRHHGEEKYSCGLRKNNDLYICDPHRCGKWESAQALSE